MSENDKLDGPRSDVNLPAEEFYALDWSCRSKCCCRLLTTRELKLIRMNWDMMHDGLLR